jgi:hypothetical protein
LLKTFSQPRRIFNFALPDNDHPPPGFPKKRLRPAITRDVPAELPLPEVDPALRYVRIFTVRMTVPKAPMNQNHRFLLRQHNVGIAVQFSIPKPEAISHSMQQAAHEAFRLVFLPRIRLIFQLLRSGLSLSAMHYCKFKNELETTKPVLARLTGESEFRPGQD